MTDSESVAIDCQAIETFSTSGFLKVNMTVQATFGVLSIVSMAMIIRKVWTTVIIDRTFKEYILLGFVIQTIQATAITTLQITLLGVHLFNGPCQAYITQSLCLRIRILSTVGMSGLSYLAVALTVYRCLVLRLGLFNASEALKTARFILVAAFFINVPHVYFKFQGANFDGYTSYCTGNLASQNIQMIVETAIIFSCEAISVIGGTLLFRSYKKTRRSFDVNTSLIRKQAIQTFHLFLPFSIVHAACFCIFGATTTLYRELVPPTEPTYSAGTGLLFIPIYFSTFGPWLIYYIIRREEKKRVESTNDLLSKEGAGSYDIYFRIMDEQWDGQSLKNDLTTKNDHTTKNAYQIPKLRPVVKSKVAPTVHWAD